MKRIVSLMLALSMVLSMFVSAFAATLKDLPGTRYQAAVEALMELGVVDGLPDGTYGADKEVTRAQLAKMLVLCLNLGDTVSALEDRQLFSDVTSGWYVGYVNAAAQAKLILGYTDGTFKPEKNVTYAEAYTMIIRALGYGNVADKEGTWPTNYTNKAVELGLNDDVVTNDGKAPKAADNATRGNIAIMLWNMLLTKMWRIGSENETDGMSSTTSNKTMLEIKFPNYEYYDEDHPLYLVACHIEDDEATLDMVDGFTEKHTSLDDYELSDVNLAKLLGGEKVRYAGLLDVKNEKVLQLNCLEKLVEGRVDDDGKLDGVKYRSGDTDFAPKGYVVAAVEGKKVLTYTICPEDNATELTAKDVEKRIKDSEENPRIYILGDEWITAEDLKEGDVVTKIKYTGNDEFYMVSRDTVEGTFESSLINSDNEKQIKVDGEKYDLGKAKIKEFKSSTEKYTTVEFDAINKKEKDNKYVGEDVKLVLDYLGNLVTVYFDEIDSVKNGEINWYVLTGNVSPDFSDPKGVKYTAVLTDVDGEEDTPYVDEAFINALTTVSGEKTYIRNYELLKELTNKLSGENKDELADEELLNLVHPLYTKNEKLVFATISGESFAMTDDDDAVEEWYFERVSGETAIYDADNKVVVLPVRGNKLVTDETVVIKIKPVIEDKEVTAIELETSTGDEELNGIKNALVVVPVETNEDNEFKGVAAEVSYIFVTESASSDDLDFGVVEEIIPNELKEQVLSIYGRSEDLRVKSAVVTPKKGAIVAWTLDEDEKASIMYQLEVTDLDDEMVVTGTGNGYVTISGDLAGLGFTDLLRDKDDDGHILLQGKTFDAFKDYTFYLITGIDVEETTADESGDYEKKVLFVQNGSTNVEVKELGKGIEEAQEEYGEAIFAKGDRLQMKGKCIAIVRIDDIDVDDVLADGVAQCNIND